MLVAGLLVHDIISKGLLGNHECVSPSATNFTSSLRASSAMQSGTSESTCEARWYDLGMFVKSRGSALTCFGPPIWPLKSVAAFWPQGWLPTHMKALDFLAGNGR